MNLLTTFIALLMLGDALFALSNLARVESWLKEFFPNLDVKQLALVEGGVGLAILAIKFTTGSWS
ncbi:MAG: hypothetical protein RRB13_10135 [bacterium]|nr:hypothetical protein [bacterium]